jgi:hypothetical protein
MQGDAGHPGLQCVGQENNTQKKWRAEEKERGTRGR